MKQKYNMRIKRTQQNWAADAGLYVVKVFPVSPMWTASLIY